MLAVFPQQIAKRAATRDIAGVARERLTRLTRRIHPFPVVAARESHSNDDFQSRSHAHGETLSDRAQERERKEKRKREKDQRKILLAAH